MTRPILALASLAAVVSLATLAACTADRPTAPAASAIAIGPSLSATPGEIRPSHYVVVFRGGVSGEDALAARLVTAHGGSLEHVYHSALKGFAATIPASELAALRAHDEVALVEPDAIMRAITTQAGATRGLDRIDQRALPLSGTYTYSNSGAGVNVYIIDSGIRYTHTEFGGRAKFAFDAVGDGRNGVDCNGHGTHVSGTVGGTRFGVAKQAKLFGVRVLDCTGSGFTSGVIAGIDWVTSNHAAPAVANMSLGGSASAALDQAVTNSIASGVTYAIAAGNSNANACLESPARTPNALTVGATTVADARASFSNFGSCVDIFAPGVAITSAWLRSDNDTNTISGTSMAAPHVAGVAALYLQSNPGATPAMVMQALRANATAGIVQNPGTGSPNLLLFSQLGGNPPPDAPPVAAFSWSCNGLTCTFDASASTDDIGIVSYAWNFGQVPNGTGSGRVASTTYPHTGQRTVTLTVRDGSGQQSVLTKTITVGGAPPPDAPPVARFTASCNGLTCTFDASSSTDDVGIVSYAWDFGQYPNGTGSGKVVTTTYPHASQRTVTLTVRDTAGQTGTKSMTITVQ